MPEGNFWVNIGGCLVLAGAAVAAIVLVVVFARRHRRHELANARRAFEDSLAQLRKDPKNADLKRETVHLGQCYSRLSIGRDGRPVFDETALDKAIAAVCPPELYPSPAEASLATRLDQLTRYRQRGLITEQEYQQKRDELLADSSPTADRWGQKLDHN